MALNLTPDMLAQAYDFLCTTAPFKGWHLPHSDDIGFHVVRNPHIIADFTVEHDDSVNIRVSTLKGIHTNTLLMTVAHEMIHLHQYRKKIDSKRVEHNANFKRHARRVCKIHGWDETVF